MEAEGEERVKEEGEIGRGIDRIIRRTQPKSRMMVIFLSIHRTRLSSSRSFLLWSLQERTKLMVSSSS